MSRELIFAPAARRDLEEIWDYIAGDSFDAADRWLENMESASRLLAENPKIGHPRRDLTDLDVLFWPVGRYLIVYRTAPEHVEIYRVLSAYRDVSRLL